MKFTEEYLKENGFPLELDLTEIIEEDKKARKIISRIIMTGAFIATHNDMKGPATHVEIPSMKLLNGFADQTIGGIFIVLNPSLENKIVVKRENKDCEDDSLEFLIKE